MKITILFVLLLHGHHYGWQQPQNPHHQTCAVAFHVGCAVADPPPYPGPFPLRPPVPFQP